MSRHGEAVVDEELLERLPGAVRLRGRAAVRDRRWPGPSAPPRRPVAVAGRQSVPSRRRPSRAVIVTRSPAGKRGHRRGEDRRQGAGQLARPGAVRGQPGDGQQPQVLRPRLALADGRDPGAIGQPADRPPDARPRLDAVARRGRRGAARLRGPATALARHVAVEWAHDEVDEPVVDPRDGRRVARRARQRLEPEQGAGLAVLPGPRCDLRPRRQVRRQPDDLEPAVGVRDEDEPAVGQPADAALPGGAVADHPFRAVGDRHDRDPRGVAGGVRPIRGDRQPGPVRVTTRTPRRRCPTGDTARAGSGRGVAAGRPRRGTGASTTQAWAQPRRREMNARRRPSGDQRGADSPAGWWPSVTSRVPSASTIAIAPSRTNASRRPSGDQRGSETAFSDAVIWVAGPPRSGRMKSWRAPAASCV